MQEPVPVQRKKIARCPARGWPLGVSEPLDNSHCPVRLLPGTNPFQKNGPWLKIGRQQIKRADSPREDNHCRFHQAEGRSPPPPSVRAARRCGQRCGHSVYPGPGSPGAGTATNAATCKHPAGLYEMEQRVLYRYSARALTNLMQENSPAPLLIWSRKKPLLNTVQTLRMRAA